MTTSPLFLDRRTYQSSAVSLFLILGWFLLLVGSPQKVHAQYYQNRYRPPVDWQQIQTPRFRIIYPSGYDSTAFRTASLLENHYADAQELVGGSLSKFPVILNPYNDRSNGFVTPYNFRMEVEIAPIRGKGLSPESGDWLNTVMPHELIHALHLNKDAGLSSVVKLFGPDFARSFHTAVPGGFLEGIAVEYESDYVRHGGGRGHYSYFTNPIYAIRSQQEPWSMGELVFRSANTLPYNRHYLGGYDFTDWLQDTYGSETTREAIDFYAKWPFLGYGVALRHSTGKWPNQLHDQYKSDRLDTDQRFGVARHDPAANVWKMPFEGEQWFQPVWLDDDRLLAYGQFYDARPGFYEINTRSEEQSPQLVYESGESEDHAHTLISKDGTQQLLFSRYKPNLLWDEVSQSAMFRLDPATQRVSSFSNTERLYSPAELNGNLIAIQTWHNRNRLVSVSKDSIQCIYEPTLKERLIELAASSYGDRSNRLAVVMNRNGKQGLWITKLDKIAQDLAADPQLSIPNGSIMDPAWHPNENKLLLTIARDSLMQLYAYDLDQNQLSQLTHGTLNTLEGRYSPDGSRIAYIVQDGNQRRLATATTSDLNPTPVSFDYSPDSMPSDPYWHADEIQQRMDTTAWKAQPYRDHLAWLKPRLIEPGVEEENNGNVYSLTFYSADPLQQNTYDAKFSYKYKRFWHDITYRYSGFYPGFDFSSSTDALLINDPDFYLMERRFEFGLPFPFRLDANNRSSRLYLRPFAAFTQIRALEKANNDPFTDFTNRPTLGITAGLNYRLQANPRDVQPNAGWSLFAEVQQDMSVQTPSAPPRVGIPKRNGFQARISRYLSLPFMRRWNQSLQVTGRYLTQSNAPIYNIDPLIHDAFDSYPFARLPNNLGSLNARYTIPLAYIDDGGLLIPFYLQSVYLVSFSSTVADLDQSDWQQQTKSVLGAGIRTRFQFGALNFDLGIALTWEPSADQINYFIGSF
jgi:hypothetical protein